MSQEDFDNDPSAPEAQIAGLSILFTDRAFEEDKHLPDGTAIISSLFPYRNLPFN